jgi:hypothetical protein
MKRKKMMPLFAALLIASIVAGYLSIQNPGVLNSSLVFQSEKFQEDGLKFHSTGCNCAQTDCQKTPRGSSVLN